MGFSFGIFPLLLAPTREVYAFSLHVPTLFPTTLPALKQRVAGLSDATADDDEDGGYAEEGGEGGWGLDIDQGQDEEDEEGV